VLGGYQQELCLCCRDWLQVPACTKQSGECRRVGGDDIVGAAFLFGARIDARRMDRKGSKVSCGAPVESRPPTRIVLLLQMKMSVMCGFSSPGRTNRKTEVC
jgi:hypothetical protein